MEVYDEYKLVIHVTVNLAPPTCVTVKGREDQDVSQLQRTCCEIPGDTGSGSKG